MVPSDFAYLKFEETQPPFQSPSQSPCDEVSMLNCDRDRCVRERRGEELDHVCMETSRRDAAADHGLPVSGGCLL